MPAKWFISFINLVRISDLKQFLTRDVYVRFEMQYPQLTFTCSNLKIETLKKVLNMFKVNNKNTRTTSTTSITSNDVNDDVRFY